MPRITVPIPANYEAISRPVMIDLVRKILKICNLPSNTPVNLSGEYNTVSQSDSTMGSRDVMNFEGQSRLTGEGVDVIKDIDILQMPVRSNDYPPMWEDPNLGISLRPVYMSSEITLTMTYTAKDRASAIKWRDEHAVRRAEGRGAMAHEIQYEIPIPDGIIDIIAHLHSLREKVSGYDETFVEYFQKHQKRIFRTLATQDMDSDKFVLSCPEKQAMITGHFEFEEIPREQKVDGNTTWELQFGYRLSYLRCVHLYLAYPMVVHQQHIGTNYFDPAPRFQVDDLPKTAALAVRAMDIYRGVGLISTAEYGGLRIPAYDDWIPAAPAPRGTKPAITWMIAIDSRQPELLFDFLADMEDMDLTLEMVEYLKVTRAGVFHQGRSAVHIQVWKGDYPMAPELFYLTDDLKLYCMNPLPLRSMFHVRLSFNTLYSMFTPTAIDTMMDHAVATVQIMKSILPTVDSNYLLSNLLLDKYLPRERIQWFYNFIRHKNIGIDAAPDDFTREPWDYTKGGNDPGIGSGSTWKEGKANPYHKSLDDANLPNSFTRPSAKPRYVQYLAIMVRKREVKHAGS